MSLSEIFTTILSIFAMAFLVSSFILNVTHDKKRDTLDAYYRLQGEVFDELNRYQYK